MPDSHRCAVRALYMLLPTHGFKQKCDLTSGALKWSTETHFSKIFLWKLMSERCSAAAKHLSTCLSAAPVHRSLGGQSFLSATNRGLLLGLLLCHNILVVTLVSGKFRKLVKSLNISDSASIPVDSTELTKLTWRKNSWTSALFFAFELVGFCSVLFCFFLTLRLFSFNLAHSSWKFCSPSIAVKNFLY